jgi:D-glycero-D-manno-heptose 1,7-bisphosphate phosphatase
MAPKKIKMVIFDRDGTLIRDTGYPIHKSDLYWMPGALSLLKELKKREIHAVIATNQSGVARGLFSLEAVHKFHKFMLEQIEKAGGHISKIEICPHLLGAKVKHYSLDCTCRKPKPEMINRLLSSMSCSPDNTIMIGDRISDIEAGKSAGVESYLFDQNDLEKFVLSKLKREGGSLLYE